MSKSEGSQKVVHPHTTDVSVIKYECKFWCEQFFKIYFCDPTSISDV
jgi:hypothetical protein